MDYSGPGPEEARKGDFSFGMGGRGGSRDGFRSYGRQRRDLLANGKRKYREKRILKRGISQNVWRKREKRESPSIKENQNKLKRKRPTPSAKRLIIGRKREERPRRRRSV